MPDAQSAALHAEHALNAVLEAQRVKLAAQMEATDRLHRMHLEPIGQTTDEDGDWG